MSHINLFQTVAEFESAYTNDYIEPWLSYTIEGSGLTYNKKTEPTPSHEYVDLGLRVGGNKILFATMNIGASSPEEYGDYFAWGETSKRYTGINGDSIIGGSFAWDNCPYCTNSEGSKFSKYIDEGEDQAAESGTADGKTVLEPVDDVATVLWGGNWRMPDKSDLDYLISDNVIRTWTDNYNETGISGLLISGKDSFSESSIFLPSAGYVDGNTIFNDEDRSGGVYTCREIYGVIYINTLFFNSEQEAQVAPALVRYNGLPVRPVLVLPE
jgi:hypothetical protein